jgi:hemoglobin-like flavoprotein
MLTNEQKRIVQETFAAVTPIANEVGMHFYERLFEIEPSLRSMFRGDIQEQSRKLMLALTFTVKSLDDLEQLVPVLEDLGRRHVNYGVQAWHYNVVGEALLATLESHFKEAFTAEVADAWKAAYQTVASVMTGAEPTLRMPVPAATA